MKGVAVFGICLACGIAYLVGTSPKSVVPPVFPASSMVNELPPWPLYRFFVGLNDVLRYLAEATTPPDVRALELANSFWQSVTTYALLEHGAIDALGKAGTCHEVAERTGKNEHYLCRFMHAGATLGIFKEPRPNYFEATAISEELRTNSRDRALWLSKILRDNYVATAEKSIETGKPGCEENLGSGWWDWNKGHPEAAEMFDRAMKDFTLRTAAAVVGGLQLRGDEVICDVGGGIGTLLSIVWEHWPTTSIILFDIPETAERAKSFLASKNVSNATIVPGTFFEPLPSQLATCDYVFLKNVLHDWPDDACVEILSNIKNHAKKGAKLLVVEAVLGTDGLAFERAKAFVEGGILTTCPIGAKERTLPEFQSLFSRAQIDPPEVLKLRELLSIIEAPL